jgi:hypothetical protein
MEEKRLKHLLIVPLLIVNLFNVAFILFKLKETDFLKEAKHILCDYFIGFHLLSLLVVLVVLSLWKFIKKFPLSLYFYRLSMVILLYLIAVNLSLFPEINEDFGRGKYDFRWKKDPSLEEAVKQSPAKVTKAIESYIQMNQHLSGKILITPSSHILKKDYFFKVFIEPGRIREQDYEHRLSDGSHERLEDFPSIAFPYYGEETGIQKYRIILGIPSDKFLLYVYRETILFIPSDLRSAFL